MCAAAGSMAGPRIPTDVKPNKFVEANGYAREVVENTFRFSLKNLGKFAIFGIAVPVLIYKGCVQEFVSAPPPIRISRPARPIEGGVWRSEPSAATHASSTLVCSRSLDDRSPSPATARPSRPGEEGTLANIFPLSRLLSGPKPSTDRL